MSEVVVVGSFEAREGKEQDALEAFKALVGPTHASNDPTTTTSDMRSSFA